MANLLTAFSPEYWAPTMQETFFKENVALALTNAELRAVLVNGTKVHRPYRSGLKSQTLSKGVEISTFVDLTATDEYLEVNTAKVVPFIIDGMDEDENLYNTVDLYAKDAQRVLNNQIDQAVLAEYSNAYSFISAQDLGGSGTSAASVSKANVSDIFAIAGRNLDKYNRGQQERYAVVGPRLRETLRLSLAGKETGFGDKVGENGIIGSRFGFDLYFTNNIPFTATLTSSSIPVAAETVTVDGVVFTWAANGAATAAGEVSIGTNEAEAYANLVLAINGTGTPGASTYCDVSADDREALYNGSLTASFNTHTLTISGYGDVVISEATTNLAVTTNVQYPLFGVKKSIDFVVRDAPQLVFRDMEKHPTGRRVYAWTNYGKKTFIKEKKSLTYLKLNTANWV